MEVFGIFSKAGTLVGEEEQEDAMVRVVAGAWIVGWGWVRVAVCRSAVGFVVVEFFFAEVEVEEEKPRAPEVVKVDRRTMVDVEEEEEDKVARRNRALVDCIRIVLR